MKIFILVKAGTKQEKVERLDGKNFKVWVKTPPVEGRANMAAIKALAEYFKLPKSSVEILSGFKSKEKVIEITKEKEKPH